MSNVWHVGLEGVYLSGGPTEAMINGTPIDEMASGDLSVPPEGLGVPGLRVEDTVYLQRDGVRHFSDWYEPRIITLADVSVCSDDCPSCDGSRSARAKVRDISQAWSRKCDDVELVVYTPCHGDPDRVLNGPYGIVGRPRVAAVDWATGQSGCARMTLRFDAVDHRMFVLDAAGTPGSGEKCVTLGASVEEACRTYPRCYPGGVRCYTPVEEGGTGPVGFQVDGTECVYPTITLSPSLTNPEIENTVTGEKIGYAGRISSRPVTIDTYSGTATQGGQSRTHLLTGSLRFPLSPGENTLRLTSYSSADTGSARVCWRPTVVQG